MCNDYRGTKIKTINSYQSLSFLRRMLASSRKLYPNIVARLMEVQHSFSDVLLDSFSSSCLFSENTPMAAPAIKSYCAKNDPALLIPNLPKTKTPNPILCFALIKKRESVSLCLVSAAKSLHHCEFEMHGVVEVHLQTSPIHPWTVLYCSVPGIVELFHDWLFVLGSLCCHQKCWVDPLFFKGPSPALTLPTRTSLWYPIISHSCFYILAELSCVRGSYMCVSKDTRGIT